jgi:hypothetical protein
VGQGQDQGAQGIVAKLEEEKEEIPKKYTKEFASDIIEKLFGDFKKGGKWLDWTKQHARENCYTYSPIGMRRNLFSMLTGINSIMAAMERRAANSPIQGFASQIGITAHGWWCWSSTRCCRSSATSTRRHARCPQRF